MKTKRHSILKQSIAFFCIAVVLALIMSAIASYFYNVSQIEKQSATNAKAGASAAAEVVEETGLSALQQSETSDTYLKTRRILKSICKSFNLEYLYLYVPDVENGTVRYIMTVASSEENDLIVADERGLNVTLVATLSSQELAALNGQEDYSIYEEDNSYGHVYSWFYRVANSNGESVALIGCDYRIDTLYSKVIQETLLILLPMIIALAFIFVLFVVFMNKKIFSPIRLVSQRMNGFVDDREKKIDPLNISSGDEIQCIADSFEKMSNDINLYIQRNNILLTQSVQAKVQMEVANRIQCGIVPTQFTFGGQNFGVKGYAKPCKEVGGDFYDCFTLPNNSVCLFIGDVSGKGIGAALFMVMVKTMLKDYLNSRLSPAECLNKVNDILCQSNPEGMFATVFVAIFNPENGKVIFANAGHTKPILAGDSPKFLTVKSGVALGLFEDAQICDESFTLNNNEGLLLYTDGVTEAINADKKFYGESRLITCVNCTHSADEIVNKLNSSVTEFCGESEQFDDYTVLALFYNMVNVTNINLPLSLDSLQILKDALINNVSDNFDKKKIYLASEEVFTNIVNYSNAKSVQMKIESGGDNLKIVFIDDGVVFNPLANDKSQKQFEDFDEGGMGLAIIKKLAKVDYERKNNCNFLSLNFIAKEGK